MILSLSIRDFVLIDRLDIEPGAGFTALTGETGAGKSIILDALSLAMGHGSDRGMIRAGQDQSSVAVEFSPPVSHPVWSALAEAGIDASPDETLTMKRVIRRNGPARAFLNDQPVSAALLSEIGDLLVEIHGQHAASTLLKPSSHRRLLDQFAGNEKLLDMCATTHAAMAEASARRQELEDAHAEAIEHREWLAEAVAELSSLNPQEGEAAILTERRTLLMQSERVTEAVREAENVLEKSGVEDAYGTTDVTRTVPIGDPSADMRRHYTLVLKGHISLAMVRFPKGTTGTHLDILARHALWQAGLDYQHGTGHGVGVYLGVHEGPQRIAKAWNSVPLETGMIVSNEPGYYRAGQYGIRIENLQYVTPPAAIEGGELDMYGFECLTFAPLARDLIDLAHLTKDERDWVDAYHAQVYELLADRLDGPVKDWLRAACMPL